MPGAAIGGPAAPELRAHLVGLNASSEDYFEAQRQIADVYETWANVVGADNLSVRPLTVHFVGDGAGFPASPLPEVQSCLRESKAGCYDPDSRRAWVVWEGRWRMRTLRHEVGHHLASEAGLNDPRVGGWLGHALAEYFEAPARSADSWQRRETARMAAASLFAFADLGCDLEEVLAGRATGAPWGLGAFVVHRRPALLERLVKHQGVAGARGEGLPTQWSEFQEGLARDPGEVWSFLRTELKGKRYAAGPPGRFCR